MNILLVDDDEGEGELLVRWLIRGPPANFRQVFTLAEALETVPTFRPDLVFLDAVLPPYTGPAETLPRLRQAGYPGPVIVSSMLAAVDLPGGPPADARVRVVCKSELTPLLLQEIISGFPA